MKNKMNKFKKILKKNIIGLMLGFVAASSIGVYAATTLSSSSIYYNNANSGGASTNVKGAIDELYSKTKPINFKVGDYVTMTPTKTSFNIPKTLTGYTADQTINPSELNKWRVIRINSDGTVDMVSQDISSKYIYISGQTGYLNYVGMLNYVAKQYENPKYTSGSRYIGYNNQTEYITNTSYLTPTTPTWTSNTTNNTNEIYGGGDVLYTTDTGLISTALGNLITYKVGTTTATGYWLASRYYFYVSSTNLRFLGRAVNANGGVSYDNIYQFYNGANYNTPDSLSTLRPILTLKSGLKAYGSGTSNDPYTFEKSI